MNKIQLIGIILAIGIASLSFCGCAGYSAVYVPGLGHFEKDPMPLTSEDQHLRYFALAKLLDAGVIGSSEKWENLNTGASGKFVLTRKLRRNRAAAGGAANAPAGEFNEYVWAQDREDKTLGMAAYRDSSGRWFRYK